MKLIPLTRDRFAAVSDCDFKKVKNRKWHAVKTKEGKWYAGSNSGRGGASKFVAMHRVLAGAKKGQTVDHKDGNGLNNRRSNLRICTRSQNCANAIIPKHNKSGFKGVSFHKQAGKWRASIKIKGKKIALGLFDSKLSAAVAYDQAAIEIFGEFSKTNRSLGLL